MGNKKEKMKAISLVAKNQVQLKEISKPKKAAPEHLIIKMHACGVNAGDNAFIGGTFPPGSIPISFLDVCGVSGVGTVIETGEGVPDTYEGKNVTVYRSLKFSDNIIGTWSEYAQLHYLHCVILPDNVNIEEYSGSLVNIITPYAFLKQIEQEGHKGIICTAGNSATGIAMLGVCLAKNFPLISVVRNEEGRKELDLLGAKNIVMQSDISFKQQLNKTSKELKATAIFDGVGGEILNTIVDEIPFGSTVYAYGYLGGQTPFSFHTSILMKGITIKGFANFRTQTVQNPHNLEAALKDISSIIDMPHFKTKNGRKFSFEEIKEALMFSSTTGKKAVLYPSY